MDPHPTTHDLNETEDETMDEQAKITPLELWHKVSKTDPDATKGIRGGDLSGMTSIAALWPIKVATREFGLMGTGWGYEIISESFVPGAPFYAQTVKDSNETTCIGNEQTHTLQVKVWAMYKGNRLEAINYGHTPHIYSSVKYQKLITDHEYGKKSLSDALKKTLSMWGFSADIFLGEFDNPEYKQAITDEFAIEKADDKDAEILKQKTEYLEECERFARQIETSVGMNELQALFTAAVRKATRKNDDAFIKRITKLKDKRKNELLDAVAEEAQ